MKASKVRRKELTALRNMGDVPWPARRYRYAPTFGGRMVVGRCPQVVGEVPVRKPGVRNRLRKPVRTSVVCGGEIVLVPFKGVHCSSCRDRRGQRREMQRALKSMQSVRVHSREPVRESSLKGLSRFFSRRGQRGA